MISIYLNSHWKKWHSVIFFFSKSANTEWQNPGSLTLCLQNPKTVNWVKGPHQAGSLGPQRGQSGTVSARWSVPDILLQPGPNRGGARMRKPCGPFWCPSLFPPTLGASLTYRGAFASPSSGQVKQVVRELGISWWRVEKEWDRVSVRETGDWGTSPGFRLCP